MANAFTGAGLEILIHSVSEQNQPAFVLHKSKPEVGMMLPCRFLLSILRVANPKPKMLWVLMGRIWLEML